MNTSTHKTFTHKNFTVVLTLSKTQYTRPGTLGLITEPYYLVNIPCISGNQKFLSGNTPEKSAAAAINYINHFIVEESAKVNMGWDAFAEDFAF